MSNPLYPTPGFSNYGVGAGETAYFIATGPTYATDGNGGANFNFEADDRQAALPDWASVNGDGDIELTEDAGTVGYSFVGVCDFDFSGASSVPDSDGTISSGGFVGQAGGNNLFNVGATGEPGDGQDAQTSTAIRTGGLVAGSVLSVTAFPTAQDAEDVVIGDGTATPRVALTVTRIAQAAVLPD